MTASLADRPQPGYECKLYYDNADDLTGSSIAWLLASGVRDLKRADGREKIDASARYSKTKRSIVGMFEGPLTFDYIKRKGTNDAAFAKLKAKYDSGEPIQMAVTDADIAVAGTIYRRDWYVITKFDEGQEMAKTVMFDCEMEPTPVFGSSGALVEFNYGVVSA